MKEEYIARGLVGILIIMLLMLWVYPIKAEIKIYPVDHSINDCSKKYEIYEQHCNDYLKSYPNGSCEFLYDVYKEYCSME